MNGIDLTQLSDRELVTYLLLGDLPKPGWPGRRRAIAGRVLAVAVRTLFLVLFLIALLGIVVLVAAAMDALPLVPR